MLPLSCRRVTQAAGELLLSVHSLERMLVICATHPLSRLITRRPYPIATKWHRFLCRLLSFIRFLFDGFETTHSLSRTRRLLHPDKPLTAVDSSFCKEGQDSRGAPSGRCKSAWMSGADGGAVWTSYTRINPTASITHFALAINVSRTWVIQRDDLWPRAKNNATYVTRQWGSSPCSNASAAVGSGCVHATPPGAVLTDLHCHPAASDGSYQPTESPFVLIAVHEVMANGWVLWEEGKYVARTLCL